MHAVLKPYHGFVDYLSQLFSINVSNLHHLLSKLVVNLKLVEAVALNKRISQDQNLEKSEVGLASLLILDLEEAVPCDEHVGFCHLCVLFVTVKHVNHHFVEVGDCSGLFITFKRVEPILQLLEGLPDIFWVNEHLLERKDGVDHPQDNLVADDKVFQLDRVAALEVLRLNVVGLRAEIVFAKNDVLDIRKAFSELVCLGYDGSCSSVGCLLGKCRPSLELVCLCCFISCYLVFLLRCLFNAGRRLLIGDPLELRKNLDEGLKIKLIINSIVTVV